ncbi:MAG: glycoside hydrolase family 16 protein [Chloroflexota bacterium]
MKYVLLLLFSGFVLAGAASAQESRLPPEAALFFDDFNYQSIDSPAFTDNGWIVRTADGWPGIPGTIWSPDSVSIVADPDEAGNRLVQMTASSDGTTVHQAQFCQQRKFLSGTYASRVHFSDQPATGPDGDNIVQTFSQISPLASDLDPDYSELDFEYLPNGGWGVSPHVLFVTSWETFRPEPHWLADNVSGSLELSFAGWHTLVLTVGDGEISYYVDGHLLDIHDGDVYPEVPMSLNYNLWFINGGQIDSDEAREYVEYVDWSFHLADTVLAPDDVETLVAAMRGASVDYVNLVPDADPVLESPCNF